MPVIAVINRKGGSGKSTLATHLAAHCANTGLSVMLGDLDPQQSTQVWLRLRAERPLQQQAHLVGWAVDARRVLRPPAGVSHVVLDTPGGLRGFDLARVVASADVIVMPVCSSVFDREAAAECHAELLALPRVASGRCRIGAVGMRLDGRTRAAEVLSTWAAGIGLPFLGVLRETQAYVRCVEQGLTVFDLPGSLTEFDRAQWQPILDWLEPVLRPEPARQARPMAKRPTYACHPLAQGGPAPHAGAASSPALDAEPAAASAGSAPTSLETRNFETSAPNPMTASTPTRASLRLEATGARPPDAVEPVARSMCAAAAAPTPSAQTTSLSGRLASIFRLRHPVAWLRQRSA